MIGTSSKTLPPWMWWLPPWLTSSPCESYAGHVDDRAVREKTTGAVWVDTSHPGATGQGLRGTYEIPYEESENVRKKHAKLPEKPHQNDKEILGS